MASRKQRPVKLAEVCVGHTYYLPIPAHRGGVTPGGVRAPGGALMIPVTTPREANIARAMVRDGLLLYRSKGKAKRQAVRGNWLLPWRERELFRSMWQPPKASTRAVQAGRSHVPEANGVALYNVAKIGCGTE